MVKPLSGVDKQWLHDNTEFTKVMHQCTKNLCGLYSLPSAFFFFYLGCDQFLLTIFRVATCITNLCVANSLTFTCVHTVTELTAHNSGKIVIPVITCLPASMTHCSPHSIEADLNPASTFQRSIDQTNCSINAILDSCGGIYFMRIYIVTTKN